MYVPGEPELHDLVRDLRRALDMPHGAMACSPMQAWSQAIALVEDLVSTKALVAPDDGGPAFPTNNAHQSGPNTYHFEGLTARDWFAGTAVAGLVLMPLEQLIERTEGITVGDYLARQAYGIADSMLKARKQP